ncbi:hypothetical protein Tco_0668915 [Tanacetum coccineum]
MIEEPVKSMKKKDIIRLDEEVALKLQAEFDEEERLARQKAKKEKEDNIALIKEWDDIQAKIDVEYQLDERMQVQEQEDLSIEEKATLFQQLLDKEESIFQLKEQKREEINHQQKLNRDKKSFKRVNTFEDFRTELVEGKEKRAGEELMQENEKKQKMEHNKETAELKQCLEIIPDEEEVTIDAIPLAVKSPSIVGWKIHKEGRKSYYQIIRADRKSQMYMLFSHMLKSFSREDLEDLYKLVKAKYKSTRLVEYLDLLLWGDLKTMFEPHVEDTGRIVGIKSLFDAVGITAAHVYVNTALMKKLKGKDIVDTAAQVSNATTITPGMYKLVPVTLAPKDKNNRETHIYYLKHTIEQAAILREIVEQAKSLNPFRYEKLVATMPINKKKTVRFDKPVISSSTSQKQLGSSQTQAKQTTNNYVLTSTGVSRSTKSSRSKSRDNTKNDRILQISSSTEKKNKVEDHSRIVKSCLNKPNCVVEPSGNANVQHSKLNINSELMCVKCNSSMFDARHEMCFLEFVSDMNASSKSKSVKKAKKTEEWKPTRKVFTKIGYNWRPTGRTFTLVGNACPLTRITATNKVPFRKHIPLEVVAQESVVTKVYTRRLKPLCFDLKSLRFDLKSLRFGLKSLRFGLKSLRFGLKSLRFDLKSLRFDSQVIAF